MTAEWIKLTSIRGIRASLAALIATTVGLSLLISSGTQAPVDPMEIRLSGVYFGQLAAAWLGVTAIGAEFATGMIQTTLVATPSRTRVLLAKAATVGALTLGASLIATLAASFAAGAFVDAGLSLRAIAGSAVYMTLVALLSLGIGAIVRGTNAALSVATGILFLPAIAISLLPTDLGLQVARFCPMFAGLAIQRTVTQPDSVPISPGAGLALFAAYTAVALAGGVYVLNKS
jgi:ABC-2 type transport system permease protein